MGNYVAVNSQKKRPVCSGCLVPAMLDRDELAIHKEVVAPKGRIILEAMKFLNAKERQLMIASSGSLSTKVQELLKSGAPADTYDENRTSPLHVACRQGSIEVIQELIEHRAAIDITDCAGWTALHIAAYSCRTDVVRLLLLNNADATIVNRTGETPWDLASDNLTQQEFIKYWKLKSDERESPIVQSASKVLYDINAKKAFPRPQASVPEKDKKSLDKKWEKIDEVKSRVRTAEDSNLISELVISFNSNPQAGLSLLILFNYVEQEPKQIAQFLFSMSLDPHALGLFLSLTENFYSQVAKEFISLLPLNKANLIHSLKVLLTKVQMPSDTTRTSQLIRVFSQVFWTDTSHFKSSDAVESLALSLLMLDFSLHDPTSSPMSKSEFTTSTSGMHDGEDFSDKYLSWAYQEVKKASIRGRPQASINKSFPKSAHSGHLAFRSSSDWKERYFILKSSILFTFPSNSASCPSSLIPVSSLSVHFDTRLQHFTISSSLPFCQFKLSPSGQVQCKLVSRVYFKAGNLKLWLEGFQSAEDVKVTIV